LPPVPLWSRLNIRVWIMPLIVIAWSLSFVAVIFHSTLGDKRIMMRDNCGWRGRAGTSFLSREGNREDARTVTSGLAGAGWLRGNDGATHARRESAKGRSSRPVHPGATGSSEGQLAVRQHPARRWPSDLDRDSRTAIWPALQPVSKGYPGANETPLALCCGLVK
jgi:hypothetical protein